MKFSVVIAIAGAVAVTAVDIPADFPPCAKNCGDNMNALAPSLGCQATDAACLCKNVNYGYGVRDCSVQSCLNDTAANIAITWVNKLCTDAGVTLNLPPSSGSGSGGSGSGSGGGATGTPITTSSVVVTVTSGSSTFESTSLTTIYSAGGVGASGSPTGGEGSSTAITTSAFTSVVTSGSVVSTITGLTTIFGPVPQTTATGGASTTGTETGTGTGAATGTTLSTTASGQTSASASKASSSSSSGPGCQMTAAPMAGFIAAAGLAAAFL